MGLSSTQEELDRVWRRAKKISEGEHILDYHTKGLFTLLQTTIGSLNDVAKECSLDLAIFPSDRKICVDALLDIWVYVRKLERHDACDILSDLASKSLLNLTINQRESAPFSYGNTSELYFSQHNVLRNLALYLGLQNNIDTFLLAKGELLDAKILLFLTHLFINDPLYLREDIDEHEHGEEYDDELCESYIEDDEEWLSDFMEDPFYETRKYSDEEAAEILGSPSKGMTCDGENICGICLDPLEKCHGDMKELPCKHMYHYSCILESTKMKNTCPMCRGEYDCRGKNYCEKEDRLYFPFNWTFNNIRPVCLFEEYEKYEICERKPVPRSPTWLNLELCFFQPQMEYDYEKYGIWGRKPVPRFFSEPYLFEGQKEEAFAVFDESAKASGSLGKGNKFDGKKMYGIWHMKALACKEIYDYKSILGSTKIKNMGKNMGNMTAGRKMVKYYLQIMLSY